MQIVKIRKHLVWLLIPIVAGMFGIFSANVSNSSQVVGSSVYSAATVTQTLPRATRWMTAENIQTDTMTMTQTSTVTHTVSVTQKETVQSSTIITKTQAASNILWLIYGGVGLMLSGMLMFFLFGFRDGDNHGNRALREIVKDIRKR